LIEKQHGKEKQQQIKKKQQAIPIMYRDHPFSMGMKIIVKLYSKKSK
jgi:hypothetical protein